MASMAGKSPQPWLSVYSATKAAVVACTSAMNKELNGAGVKSVAFCPGFVDTDMSEFVKESIPSEEMIKTSDIAEALQFVLQAVAELRDPGDRVRAPRRGAVDRHCKESNIDPDNLRACRCRRDGGPRPASDRLIFATEDSVPAGRR